MLEDNIELADTFVESVFIIFPKLTFNVPVEMDMLFNVPFDILFDNNVGIVEEFAVNKFVDIPPLFIIFDDVSVVNDIYVGRF